ncbi:hypothetical protein KFK09_002452 [Dendrobium nobile]|uniref:Uncharacterized protein n=1 Tax=Dendrobium nobile TaxID=94219 RepID=A0A8T3C6G4_DENNO|nr:hypothetical protein KFK09_002452 [Dendrobium nobile]
MEQLSELSESPQKKCGRSDRYSLRKSLAWDSEFFTGEGVLNPEELAFINSTYSKAVGIKLPGIHEELRQSAESTSTLDSESRALDNLEVRLFENLRASSKISLAESNQTANMEPSGKAKEQRKLDKPHLRSLKKLDISSQTKVAARNGQSRTSNKPPEISSTTPLRAMHGKSSSSVANKQIKSNRGNILSGTTAKRSSLRTPQSGFKLLSASFSSASRSASTSSDSTSSCLGIMRNSTRNTVRSSSSFSSKTLSKTTRCRTESTNQISNSGLVESTLLLSKFSPSSSIDSFPSESSSQTSTSTNHSNLIKAKCGLSSSPGIPVSTENGASQKSGGALSQSFTGNHSKIILKFDSDTKGTTSLGLRMPRPRIGYFDKEKTLLHGSNKYLLASLRSSSTKSNGNSETSAANKSKLINSPSVRSGAHPHSLNQTSKSTGGQMVLQTLDKCQLVPAKLRKESSPRIAEGNCKRNLKNKIENPNLLQPKYVMENEIHESGEQKINDHSFLTNIQQEHLQSELVSVSGTEKENLCPE